MINDHTRRRVAAAAAALSYLLTVAPPVPEHETDPFIASSDPSSPADSFNILIYTQHDGGCVTGNLIEMLCNCGGTARHACQYRNRASVKRPILKSLQSTDDLQIHPRSSQLLLL